ncbi:MAG: UbiX family flavin prenyltransferase [Candidatus Anammoxibacter sp.]
MIKETSETENIIVAITGASGVVYAQRLLQILSSKNINIHLVISEAAIEVIRHELGFKLDINNLDIKLLTGTNVDRISSYHIGDVNAPIISGLFKTIGMVIVPCSMNTLCSIASGIASNVICRAAGVTLKEGRKLVIVPREAPLSQIHLESMLKLSNAHACILPSMPGFYHNPKTIDDLIDFVVAKILDYLQIEHEIGVQYKGV